MSDNVQLKAKLLDLLGQRYQKDPGFFVNKSTISIELGITEEEAFRYADYLVNNKWATISEPQTSSWRIMITDEGKKELERMRDVIVDAKKNIKTEDKIKNSEKKKDYDHSASIKKFERHVDKINEYLENGIPDDYPPVYNLCEQIKTTIISAFRDGKSRAQDFEIKFREVDAKATDSFGEDVGDNPNADIYKYTNYAILKFASKELRSLINELIQFKEAQSKKIEITEQSYEKPLEFDVIHEEHTGKIKVFISHKFVESDQKLAATLQNSLNQHNIYGYLAERKKEYDLVFGEKIKNDIGSSDYLIAIITKNSHIAPSVHQEIGYALGVKVPVRIMAEEQEAKGVLIEGRDIEKFSRKNFEKSLGNIIKDVIKNGKRKKLTDKEKEELLDNVYRPCYNQMKNVFERREFIAEIPPNPWERLEHYLKLKTERDMRELFENFSKELAKWHDMWIDFGNQFQQNKIDLAYLLDPIFEKFFLISEHERFTFGGANHDSESWLFNCQDVIFNENIVNGEELYQILQKDGVRKYGERYAVTYDIWEKDVPEIYNEILKIIPKLVEGLGAKYSYKELDEQRNILKKSIEELTLALEDKLK